ncbi:hypothetical protein D6825_03255, partial [Candidatus Woesearchaeota archaeon]
MGSETVFTMYIKHRGFFNQKELVETIQNWLSMNDYFSNIVYKQGSGEIGKELFCQIESEKNVTEYVKFKLDTLIRTSNVTTIE